MSRLDDLEKAAGIDVPPSFQEPSGFGYPDGDLWDEESHNMQNLQVPICK